MKQDKALYIASAVVKLGFDVDLRGTDPDRHALQNFGGWTIVVTPRDRLGVEGMTRLFDLLDVVHVEAFMSPGTSGFWLQEKS